jgi:hypothetical protein
MTTAQRSKARPATAARTGRRRQGGQSAMEYLVVCAVLATALFYPIQDNPASPGQARTTVQIVYDGFKAAYQNISYAISLPG